MRAFITGASGFVGRHLVLHLEAAGDDVSGTDRATGGADITDQAAIADEIRDARPDVIYHLAGQADVAGSWRDPVGTWRANTEGTMAVLNAAAAHDVGRVIVVTSAEVYGIVDSTDMPITEQQPLDPSSPYAASKAAAEMLCIQASNAGTDVIRARAFNHLGPGQSERFVAAALAARLVAARESGADSIAVGNLDACRDFTDVRDVVRAYRLLATDARAGEAYNICSGEDRAISEVAEALRRRIAPGLAFEPDPDLQRPSDLPVLRGSADKIAAHTGWQREISLDQTLDDIVSSITTPPTT